MSICLSYCRALISPCLSCCRAFCSLADAVNREHDLRCKGKDQRADAIKLLLEDFGGEVRGDVTSQWCLRHRAHHMIPTSTQLVLGAGWHGEVQVHRLSRTDGHQGHGFSPCGPQQVSQCPNLHLLLHSAIVETLASSMHAAGARRSSQS